MVVQVEQLDQLLGLAQPIPAEVDLDPARAVLQVEKVGLALRAERHDASRDGDRRARPRPCASSVERERLARRCGSARNR